jgi:hypothetical protein
LLRVTYTPGFDIRLVHYDILKSGCISGQIGTQVFDQVFGSQRG